MTIQQVTQFAHKQISERWRRETEETELVDRRKRDPTKNIVIGIGGVIMGAELIRPPIGLGLGLGNALRPCFCARGGVAPTVFCSWDLPDVCPSAAP